MMIMMIICLYYYPRKVCNFHMQVFQIKLKYHCSQPIKLQKFLRQQYNDDNDATDDDDDNVDAADGDNDDDDD